MISCQFSQKYLNFIKFKQQPILDQSTKSHITCFPQKHQEKFKLDEEETLLQPNQQYFVS